jgi:hypothetical protein
VHETFFSIGSLLSCETFGSGGSLRQHGTFRLDGSLDVNGTFESRGSHVVNDTLRPLARLRRMARTCTLARSLGRVGAVVLPGALNTRETFISNGSPYPCETVTYSGSLHIVGTLGVVARSSDQVLRPFSFSCSSTLARSEAVASSRYVKRLLFLARLARFRILRRSFESARSKCLARSLDSARCRGMELISDLARSRSTIRSFFLARFPTLRLSSLLARTCSWRVWLARLV